jgi:AcrR family transcriptional regulator
VLNRVKSRRPRGSLTRDQVITAALQLADRDGIQALSMPNLARELDCGVMTLYGYIHSKDDLLDAIAQRGLADLRLPRPLPGAPAAILLAWGRAMREALLAHPSLATIFLSHVVIGPGIFRGLEALLTALHGGGLSPRRGVHAVYAVLIYTTGFVAWELPRVHGQSQVEYATAWRREFASLPPENFPFTATVLGELATLASSEQFELGLTSLVSGLVALRTARRGSPANRFRRSPPAARPSA